MGSLTVHFTDTASGPTYDCTLNYTATRSGSVIRFTNMSIVLKSTSNQQTTNRIAVGAYAGDTYANSKTLCAANTTILSAQDYNYPTEVTISLSNVDSKSLDSNQITIWLEVCGTGWGNTWTSSNPASGWNSDSSTISVPHYHVTVGFDLDGGTGTFSTSQTFYYGTTGQKFTGTLTKTGYSFNYWYEVNNTNNHYSLNSDVADSWIGSHGPSENLKASWTIGSYNLTYDANGGSGAPAAESHNYNTTFTLSSTVPTKEGYEFKGWATSDSATTADYQPGSSYTMPPGDTILYAVWEQLTIVKIYTLDGWKKAMVWIWYNNTWCKSIPWTWSSDSTWHLPK